MTHTTKTPKEDRDMIARLADRGEQTIAKLADLPGGTKALKAVNDLRERVDELGKKVRWRRWSASWRRSSGHRSRRPRRRHALERHPSKEHLEVQGGGQRTTVVDQSPAGCSSMMR
jgi:hypothetical protein